MEMAIDENIVCAICTDICLPLLTSSNLISGIITFFQSSPIIITFEKNTSS